MITLDTFRPRESEWRSRSRVDAHRDLDAKSLLFRRVFAEYEVNGVAPASSSQQLITKSIISSLSSALGCLMMDSAVRPQYIALRRRCAVR